MSHFHLATANREAGLLAQAQPRGLPGVAHAKLPGVGTCLTIFSLVSLGNDVYRQTRYTPEVPSILTYLKVHYLPTYLPRSLIRS